MPSVKLLMWTYLAAHCFPCKVLVNELKHELDAYGRASFQCFMVCNVCTQQ